MLKMIGMKKGVNSPMQSWPTSHYLVLMLCRFPNPSKSPNPNGVEKGFLASIVVVVHCRRLVINLKFPIIFLTLSMFLVAHWWLRAGISRMIFSQNLVMHVSTHGNIHLMRWLRVFSHIGLNSGCEITPTIQITTGPMPWNMLRKSLNVRKSTLPSMLTLLNRPSRRHPPIVLGDFVVGVFVSLSCSLEL